MKNIKYFVSGFVLVALIFIIIPKIKNNPNGKNLTATVSGILNTRSTVAPLQKTTVEQVSKIRSVAESRSIFTSQKTKDEAEKQLRSIAIERKKNLSKLAVQNPNIAFFQMKTDLSSGLVSKLPADLVEKDVSGNAEFVYYHIDDFDNKKATDVYKIVKNNEVFDFYPTEKPESKISSRVTFSGFNIDGKIVGKIVEYVPDVNISTSNMKVSSSNPSPSIKYSTAVFLVNFNSSPNEPFTATEAKNLIFDGQFQKFTKEQSYGKAVVTGDVFGWITLATTPCNLPNGIWSNPIAGEIGKYISKNHININDYQHVLYIVDCPGYGGGWSTLGKTQAGYSVSALTGNNFWKNKSNWTASDLNVPFSWTNMDFLLAHELGHAYGLWHANGLDCGDVPLSGSCQHKEYGNPFDSMGEGQGLGMHFNAYYKYALGWLNSNQILEINKSGTYTIGNLESGSGIKAAKIGLISNGKKIIFPYYLEYRKAVGFDSTLKQKEYTINQTGLILNRLMDSPNPWSTYFSYTRLIDVMPDTGSVSNNSKWYVDSRIPIISSSNIFDDPLNGVKIGPVVSHTSNSITFKVDLNSSGCIKNPPTLSTSPLSLNMGTDGSGSVGFKVEFKNNDSLVCPNRAISITVSAPKDLYPNMNQVYTLSADVKPDGIYRLSYDIAVAPNVPNGVYNILISATDSVGILDTKILPVTIPLK